MSDEKSIEERAAIHSKKMENAVKELIGKGLKITNQKELSRQIKALVEEDCSIEAMPPCRNSGKAGGTGDVAIACRSRWSTKDTDVINFFFLYGYELKSDNILIVDCVMDCDRLKKESRQSFPSNVRKLLEQSDNPGYLCVIERKTVTLNAEEKEALKEVFRYLMETDAHRKGFIETVGKMTDEDLHAGIKAVEKCYRKGNPYLLNQNIAVFTPPSANKDEYMEEIKVLYMEIINDKTLTDGKKEEKITEFLKTVSFMLPEKDKKEVFDMLLNEQKISKE